MELLQFAKSRRGGELIGVVILAAGILLGASILTYHPEDSSAFLASTNTVIANVIGYYGATIAWIFVSFFGFTSLLFPAALLLVGWNRFWGKELEFAQTKLIGFAILSLALPPLFDLGIGKVWLRHSLIPSGGYLGSEINRVASSNLNGGGAAIVLVTAVLIGLLLATRISLAAIFVSLQGRLFLLGRATSLQWARFTERRRKEKMKGALLRKHLDKVEDEVTQPGAASQLRLVPSTPSDASSDAIAAAGPIVREVRGAGKFQIRKVTKADLRKAAEALSQQEQTDPFELYSGPSSTPAPNPMMSRPAPPARPKPLPKPPVEEFDDDLPIDFEDPLFLDNDRPRVANRGARPSVRNDTPSAAPRPKPQIPRPADRPIREQARPAAPQRSARARDGNDLLPPADLLIPGPKKDQINDDVHKKFLETGHLIEERCREFSVDGEVTAYHPGPVVTTFEFKPSAGVKYAKVVNLGDDLALALKAESIRIERISGSSTVGVEVPNRKRELIALREIIDSDAFVASHSM
ncbi:MAG TPA: DNA translocase FtsK 4TM domain-containing protein, partial [Thermoanaerobaculia bacterium]|nr:DNA translocase FtsK 4TM domain-containing protein [Thermoanaerobaculia bacterium]